MRGFPPTPALLFLAEETRGEEFFQPLSFGVRRHIFFPDSRLSPQAHASPGKRLRDSLRSISAGHVSVELGLGV